MKVNKHNLKMVGLKKVAGETKTLNPYDNMYLQLNYNVATGEVWTDFHCSIGGNEWSEYHDKDIINCGYLRSPHTMQDVADRISRRI